MFDSITSWIILIIVVALLFGGASKIPELAKAMGRAVGEFKKAQAEVDKEISQLKKEE